MYDTSVSEQFLSKLNPSIMVDAGLKTEKLVPFKLQEFSISTCQQAIDHFNNLIDLDLYKSTCDSHKTKLRIEPKDKNRTFSEEELIFIENERLMCKWVSNYWETRYFQIQDAETGVWGLYSPNIPQRVNDRICARLQKAGRAIRKFTVKARQEGETTWSQGKILQRLNYFGDTASLIASKDADSTDKMSKKFTDALNKLPYWNRIFLERFQTGSFYEYDNDTSLDLGYGTQSSLGRGRTLNVAHCSEVPFYKKPLEAIEDALFNAMHESPWMLQLLEGTAERRGDWFHNMWLDIVAGMETGITSFVAVFHPWYLRTDIYPTDAWMEARKEFYTNWIPTSATIKHAIKAENWVKSNPDAVAELGSNWQMPKEQMFYYEIERDAAERKGTLQNFLKEKPSDPDEAFQHAGLSLFPIKTVIEISDHAQQKIPEVYKLRGDVNEINPFLFPEHDEILQNKPIIKISAKWNPSMPRFEYELVPIKFNGYDKFDPINKVLIWEHPNNYATYGMSTDPSDGLGRTISDDAVIEILKKGTIEYKDSQACEFASPELPQNLLWPWNMALGTYYSPQEQCLFAPEINDGTELLNAMMNRGWYNVFKTLDTSKIGQDISAIKKYGFETNHQTRPGLINHLISFIIGLWLDLYSMPLINELKDLEKAKIAASTLGARRDKIVGKRDNRVLATGICLYALHRDELIGLQSKAWEERIKNENSTVTLATFDEQKYLDNGESNKYDFDYFGDGDNPIILEEEYY